MKHRKKYLIAILLLVFISFPLALLGSSKYKIVRLGGEPFEIGHQHGQQLKNEIKQEIESFLYPEVINKVFIGNKKLLLKEVKKLLKGIPTDYIREMKGIAKGSGARYEDVLMLSLYAEPLIEFEKKQKTACSVLAVTGERSGTYGTIVGRNLDWIPPKTGMILFVYKPNGKNSFMGFGMAGMPWIPTGINEKEIFAEVNVSSTTEERPKKTDNILYLIRKILAEANNLGEVENILSSSSRSSPMNITVASGTENKVVTYELSYKKIAVREPENDILVSTNHYMSPALKLIAPPAGGTTLRRYNRLYELASKYKHVTPEMVKKFMLDKYVRLESTIFTSIAIPADHKFYVSSMADPMFELVEVDKILKY